MPSSEGRSYRSTCRSFNGRAPDVDGPAADAIGGLVAALGDEDEQLRWLASLSLQGTGGGAVIATLRAFMDQAPSAVAREEAEKVLGKLETP